MSGWFWRRLGRSDARRDVEQELRFHLEMRTREYEAQGLSAGEARAAAEASFGDRADIAALCEAERAVRVRARRRGEVWTDVVSEARLALRSLWRSPAFTAAVVLTLGAGIALTTAVAGLVNAYLVRALPYPDSDRLVFVQGPGSPDWRDPPAFFEDVIAWDLDALSIVTGGSPERVWTSWVTAGFFEALGVKPVLGRLYTADEAAAGGESVAVISHSLWQRRWGGDRRVLGQTFSAYADDRPDDAEVFTIIGVMPPDFWYINRFTEVLAPLRAERSVSIARLAPGLTLADAEQRLAAAARARNPERSEVRLVPVQEALSRQVRPVLLALSGAVLLVLLLACGNAAVLQMVRAAGRDREFAVRAAIGAGRRRLVRQLLAEGLLLAAGSALLGVLLAWVVLAGFGEVLTRVLSAPVPGGTAALRIDGLALGAAAGASAIAALLFTLIPLVSLSRPDLAASLVDGSRSTDSRKRQRVRSTLVAAEVALSLTLLIGAGLLVRSAAHVQRQSLGFNERSLAAIDISLRQRAFGEPAARVALFDRMREHIEQDVPGVRIAFVSWAPFSRLGTVPVETPEQPMADSAAANVFAAAASAEYFDVMGIPVVRGRTFDATHGLGSPAVAIVSERLADRLWPGRDPVGQRIRIPASPDMHDTRPPEWRTVIGVVPEVRKTLTEENPPDLYYAWAQDAPYHAELMLRDVSGRGRLREVQDAIWRVNPELPLNTVRWIEDDVATASLPSRFLAGLLSSFAIFAVALAVLALYGVIAYAVMQRRRDIAIRMALGATRGQVIALFLRWGGGVTAAGVLAGMAGGFALSQVLRSQLHGVSATDGATYASVALLLAAAALLATWVPARRAAHQHPMNVLQSS